MSELSKSYEEVIKNITAGRGVWMYTNGWHHTYKKDAVQKRLAELRLAVVNLK